MEPRVAEQPQHRTNQRTVRIVLVCVLWVLSPSESMARVSEPEEMIPEEAQNREVHRIDGLPVVCVQAERGQKGMEIRS